MTILDDIKQQYRYGGLVQKLIFWNIGVFLISIIFFRNFSQGVFVYPQWMGLSSNWEVALPYFWTFLTYSFFHGSFWHLLFNMIILNFAGRLFLTYFTERQLLGAYILGAIFPGVVYVLAYTFFPLGNALLVGSSASIMAVLFATVSYAPLMTIRLLLIGYVKLWHIAAVILLLDILQLGLSNTGGHISHIAGAFFGYMFIFLLKRGTDLSTATNFVFSVFSKDKSKNKYTPFKKVHVNKTANANSRTTHKASTSKDINQKRIDEILDKISRSGYDSLTKEEKEFLFQQK